MKAAPKSQRAMYDETSRKRAEINETFLEMLPTMRRRDLERLIEKRPALWGRFAGYLTSGHVFADDPKAGSRKSERHHATMKVKIPDSGYVIAPHGGDYVQAFRIGRGALGDSAALKKARRAAEALAEKSRIAVDIVRVGARGQDRYLVEEVYPQQWGQDPYRAGGARHATKKKSPAQLDREIAEWQAARSGLSKHHQDLLSRRKPGGGLGAGYLTPAGWHGDPMVIEDRKLRLEALHEQPAPKFPKETGRRSHSTVKSYGTTRFRVSLGGLYYWVIVERDWERGGFVAKLVSEGIGTIMEPNGRTPGEALAALVRDLRAGDATDQKLAARIAQIYWGSTTGDVERR